jgi:hypothetical protein
MIKNCSGSLCLKQIFTRKVEVKIKEAGFVGPPNWRCRVLKTLREAEGVAAKSFKVVTTNYLGNSKVKITRSLVEVFLNVYKVTG